MQTKHLPVRVLHVTDPHLFADPDAELRGTNTDETFRAVLDHYRASGWPADLVIMTGDVIQDDSAEAYRRFCDLLRPLALPVYSVPGNHDIRPLMKSAMSEPPFHYCAVVEIGDWLLIGIDTCLDDEAGGMISKGELDCLAELLSSTTAKNVLISLHHPPLPMESKWLDQVGLVNSQDLLDVISRSEKVRIILFGHAHQDFFARHGSVQIIGTPSTCRQFKPGSEEFILDDLPPAYRRVTLAADGGVHNELIWLASNS